jgi:hypothetical protein
MKMKSLMAAMSAAALIFSASPAAAGEDASEKKQKINWEKQDGIEKYWVQVRDDGDKLVLDRFVQTDFIEFSLKPGRYRVRIAAMNKFDKIEYWTDWEELELKKIDRSAYFKGRYLLNLGIKLGAGMSYVHVLPGWNRLYRNSYKNIFINAGFVFGRIEALGRYFIFRHSGFEGEWGYMRFSQKVRLDIRSSLRDMSYGGNLFFRSNLDMPLNLIFRAGGGIADTRQEYVRFLNKDLPFLPGTLRSYDPYLKTGVSFEFIFLKLFYIETGVDYFSIFYRDRKFHSLRYFGLAGIRL